MGQDLLDMLASLGGVTLLDYAHLNGSYSLGTPAQLTDDHSMIRGHAVEGKNSPTGLHT